MGVSKKRVKREIINITRELSNAAGKVLCPHSVVISMGEFILCFSDISKHIQKHVVLFGGKKLDSKEVDIVKGAVLELGLHFGIID